MATQGAYKRIDDGLILQFDPANIKCFRGEPTVNLEPYPILSHWINSGTCTNNITETDILPPFINNQLHIWSRVVNTTGSIHFGMQPTTIIPSTTYTISIWYRQNSAGVSYPYIRTNVNNSSIGSFTYNGSSDSNSWPINTWIRITATATTPSNENGIYLSNYVGSQVGDKIWYYGYQIEQKDYVTPFVNGTRGTTVATGGGLIDLSNNQNHGEIVNNILYDSNNCGSLKFDATNAYINVNNLSSITNGTISFWSKMDDTSNWLFMSGQSEEYYILATSGLGNFYHYNVGNNTLINYVDGLVNNTPPSDLGWHYITLTGVNLSSWTIFNIGIYSGTNFKYNGKMSNIMFYDRVLSQSEIQQNYNATKSRYL